MQMFAIGRIVRRRSALERTATVDAGDDIDDLIEGAQGKAGDARNAVAADGKFPHIIVNVQELELPAGKNTISPGPRRRTLPFSSVTKTSPEIRWRVSSTV